MTIGEKIRSLRKAYNLKQKELAEKLNVSATALVFVEKGVRQPSKELVLRLSKFFNKPTDYFLFENSADVDNNTRYIKAGDLLTIADIVVDYFNKHGYELTPERRAALVEYFYNEGIIKKDEIDRLLSLTQAMTEKGAVLC